MSHVIESPGRHRVGAEGVERYRQQFAALMSGPAGQGPAWLTDVRRRALERFADLGFPTTRDEEWRFTSVAPLADQAFERPAVSAPQVTSADLDRLTIGPTAPVQLTFVNGRFAPELSNTTTVPAGVRVGSLASCLLSDPDVLRPTLESHAGTRQAFTALNTAFVEDGAFVSIPAGAAIDGWIHLLFVSAAEGRPATVSHPRVIIAAGENSQARIVESYVGAKGQRYFTNAVTDIRMAPSALVDHYKLQHESADAFHIAAMQVVAERQATFSSHSVSFGGSLVRNEVTAVLDGEGIDCTLNGLYTADGHRLIDNHTAIDHALPHCSSHEVYKGILGGHARAVFNGKIIVRPDAQKTDAKQTNKALLLSDDAQINTKPQLEIFANDVKCTHGAAVGQLDEDAIFYLRARGLGYEDARNLLIRAFAGDILNRVKLETLRADLERTLLAELPEVSRE